MSDLIVFFEIFQSAELIIGFSVILLLFLVLPLLFIIKRYKEVLSTSSLSIGVIICFLTIFIVAWIMTRIVFFPQGQYYNLGAPGGLLFMVVTVIVSLIIGLLTMWFFYKFNVQHKSTGE